MVCASTWLSRAPVAPQIRGRYAASSLAALSVPSSSPPMTTTPSPPPGGGGTAPPSARARPGFQRLGVDDPAIDERLDERFAAADEDRQRDRPRLRDVAGAHD